MDINFSCPHCEQTLVVDRTGAGETIPCPTCSREILVPLDSVKTQEIQDTSLVDIMATERERLSAERQRIEIHNARYSAKRAVEDHWRQFLTLVHVDRNKALQLVYSFDATAKKMAAQMPEPDASFFIQTIEAERVKLADEYDRNPDALKARLGLPTSIPIYSPHSNRQSMDEMIVRTVVRATIWESIWAIFRLFR